MRVRASTLVDADKWSKLDSRYFHLYDPTSHLQPMLYAVVLAATNPASTNANAAVSENAGNVSTETDATPSAPEKTVVFLESSPYSMFVPSLSW